MESQSGLRDLQSGSWDLYLGSWDLQFGILKSFASRIIKNPQTGSREERGLQSGSWKAHKFRIRGRRSARIRGGRVFS
jgi:hypothetical protein